MDIPVHEGTAPGEALTPQFDKHRITKEARPVLAPPVENGIMVPKWRRIDLV